jgi:sugar lactone lactonase YvrE
MNFRICRLVAIAVFIATTGESHAANLITLVAPGAPFGVTTSGLVADANGNLFGTAESVVYEIVKTATGYDSTPIYLASFPVLHSGPYLGGLAVDASGNLFGILPGISDITQGTLFEIVKTAEGYASAPTTVVSFDTGQPTSDIVLDQTGNIYGGTVQSDTLPGSGTVYEISKTSNGYANTPTALASFDVGYLDRLIFDTSGNLLGTTLYGGAYGYGSVFEIAKTSTGYARTPRTLVSFDGTNGTPSGLTFDALGNLFGTTFFNSGTFTDGTVFELVKTPSGYASTPTTLVNFDGTNGSQPNGLIADAVGNLFGTASGGGAYGGGTAYEIVKTSEGYASAPTILYSFCASSALCYNGSIPSGLIADANGDLFGTTEYGGPVVVGGQFGGTVFEITGSGFVTSVPFSRLSRNFRREMGQVTDINDLWVRSVAM